MFVSLFETAIVSYVEGVLESVAKFGNLSRWGLLAGVKTGMYPCLSTPDPISVNAVGLAQKYVP
jgi:hypothetical protein